MNRLRIAMTADPELPVPPTLYGGIERVVDMLIRGLMNRGHEVTLFANPDSKVQCELVPYVGRSSRSPWDTLKNVRLITDKVKRGNYDLIHSHGRLAYLLELLPRRIPKVMTYQRKISIRSVILGNLLSCGSLWFTSVSQHLMKDVCKFGRWRVIYNGVPAHLYQFKSQVAADAPLVFLGRIEYIKGTHLAIDIAKRSGRRLILAGTVEPQHQSYFNEKVAPYIDEKHIFYIGPVDDKKKSEILGQAAALLMPVLWEEPFGIVMAEALACGTPVIGLNRGAIPEIIQNGPNGFVCHSVDNMIEAVGNLALIDRKNCRHSFEEKYSDAAIVNAYEDLYRAIIGGIC